MSAIHLLHISDSHLTETNGKIVSNMTRIPHLNRRLKALSDDLDVIIHSGDIADDGSWQNLTFAKKVFFGAKFAIGRRKRSVLESLSWMSGRLVLIPGNHDRYKLENWRGVGSSVRFIHPRSCMPGGEEFDEHFDGCGCWNRAGRFSYGFINREEFRVAFIGADFSVPFDESDDVSNSNIFTKAGKGKVVEERLTKLAALTEKAKKQHNADLVFWIVHFPPKYYSKENWKERTGRSAIKRAWGSKVFSLDGEDILVAEANKLDIPGIFSGHTHRENYGYSLNSKNEGGRVFCTGQMLGRRKEAAYHIVRLEIENGDLRGVKAVKGVWDEDGHFFAEEVDFNWAS